LPFFVDINNEDLNIYIIYLIFLINSVLNYLITPYKNVIVADQKNYKLIRYEIFLTLFQFGFQFFTITILKNFYFFTLIQLFYTLINILIILSVFKNNYPFTLKYTSSKLSTEEKNKIFFNIKSLLFFKVGSIFLNGTENFIIPIFFGIRILGLISNYQVIIIAITNFASSILNGFMASIGNIQVQSNYDKEPSFYKTLYISLWLFGLIGIGLLFQIDDFIILWIGDPFVLNSLVIYGIVFSLLINNSNFASYAFRTTSGLFNKIKFLPLLAAILNILFSILLSIFIGLPGIFFGSGLARLFTFSLIDPYLVYKYNLKKSSKDYYIKLIIFSFFFILTYLVLIFIFSLIEFVGIFGFFLKTIFITFIFSLFFYLFFKSDKHFINLLKTFIIIIFSLFNSKNLIK